MADQKRFNNMRKAASGLLFILMLSLFLGWPFLFKLFNEHVYSQFPSKLRETTVSQFEKAVSPLSEWCSTASWQYDGQIMQRNRTQSLVLETQALERTASSMTPERLAFTSCVTKTKGRQEALNRFVSEYRSILETFEATLSKPNLSSLVRNPPDTLSKLDSVELKLLTNHATNKDYEQLEYGLALACGKEAMSLGAEVLIVQGQNCYEIDWISFNAFKPIAYACLNRCKVVGQINNTGKLVSLQIHPDLNVFYKIKNFKDSLTLKLKKALETTKKNMETTSPADLAEWERLQVVYTLDL